MTQDIALNNSNRFYTKILIFDDDVEDLATEDFTIELYRVTNGGTTGPVPLAPSPSAPYLWEIRTDVGLTMPAGRYALLMDLGELPDQVFVRIWPTEKPEQVIEFTAQKYAADVLDSTPRIWWRVGSTAHWLKAAAVYHFKDIQSMYGFTAANMQVTFSGTVGAGDLTIESIDYLTPTTGLEENYQIGRYSDLGGWVVFDTPFTQTMQRTRLVTIHARAIEVAGELVITNGSKTIRATIPTGGNGNTWCIRGDGSLFFNDSGPVLGTVDLPAAIRDYSSATPATPNTVGEQWEDAAAGGGASKEDIADEVFNSAARTLAIGNIVVSAATGPAVTLGSVDDSAILLLSNIAPVRVNTTEPNSPMVRFTNSGLSGTDVPVAVAVMNDDGLFGYGVLESAPAAIETKIVSAENQIIYGNHAGFRAQCGGWTGCSLRFQYALPTGCEFDLEAPSAFPYDWSRTLWSKAQESDTFVPGDVYPLPPMSHLYVFISNVHVGATDIAPNLVQIDILETGSVIHRFVFRIPKIPAGKTLSGWVMQDGSLAPYRTIIGTAEAILWDLSKANTTDMIEAGIATESAPGAIEAASGGGGADNTSWTE